MLSNSVGEDLCEIERNRRGLVTQYDPHAANNTLRMTAWRSSEYRLACSLQVYKE